MFVMTSLLLLPPCSPSPSRIDVTAPDHPVVGMNKADVVVDDEVNIVDKGGVVVNADEVGDDDDDDGEADDVDESDDAG